MLTKDRWRIIGQYQSWQLYGKHSQLNERISTTGLYPPNQSALQKYCSIETALSKFCSDLVNFIDDGQFVMPAFWNLSAAFNTCQPFNSFEQTGNRWRLSLQFWICFVHIWSAALSLLSMTNSRQQPVLSNLVLLKAQCEPIVVYSVQCKYTLG